MTAQLHQWFTPPWVCEAIVERHFPALDLGDVVLEPSCGDGRFLLALPDGVNALGVEIDPALAEIARQRTGRTIITGDFRTVAVPAPITHIIGNPPFDARVVHGFLERAHELLQEGGSCGLLLPAYILQTSSKVMTMHRRWSLEVELLPRNVFPRLKLPLVFAMLRKEAERRLVGLFLYREAQDVRALPAELRVVLKEPVKGGVWRAAVRRVFERMEASRLQLDELYAAVERPTQNRYWRQKVRQVLQVDPNFKRVGPGTWALRSNG